MYGYIYKITNKINNKIYIGKHKYKESSLIKEGLDPEYFASGKLILKALRKYGKDNFEQELLQYGSSNEELNELEKYYILKFNAIESGYNLASGGDGGDLSKFIDYTNLTLFGENNWNFGKHFKWCNNGLKEIRLQESDDIPDGYVIGRLSMSDDQKKLLSLHHKANITDEMRINLSNNWKGENNPSFRNKKFNDKNPFYGKKHSEETKKINSEKHKIRYKCPCCEYVSNHGGVTKHIKKQHIELIERASTIESITYEKYISE